MLLSLAVTFAGSKRVLTYIVRDTVKPVARGPLLIIQISYPDLLPANGQDILQAKASLPRSPSNESMDTPLLYLCAHMGAAHADQQPSQLGAASCIQWSSSQCHRHTHAHYLKAGQQPDGQLLSHRTGSARHGFLLPNGGASRIPAGAAAMAVAVAPLLPPLVPARAAPAAAGGQPCQLGGDRRRAPLLRKPPG